jgi:hypothetical protein
LSISLSDSDSDGLAVSSLTSAPLRIVACPVYSQRRPLRLSMTGSVIGSPPKPKLPPTAKCPKSPRHTAACQVGLISQACSSEAMPLSRTMYESGTPPTEPSLSWIAAPRQAFCRPKSDAQRRTTGGKSTGLELTNRAPSMAFSLLIPKLVYIRYEIAAASRVALGAKLTNVVFSTSWRMS